MCDTGRAGKQDAVSIRVETVMASIRSLESSLDADATHRSTGGFKQLPRHTSVSTDDERDVGVCVGSVDGVERLLFSCDGKRVGSFMLDPGDGERVAFPRVDAPKAEVGVRARFDIHEARQANSDSCDVAGHSLAESVGETFVGPVGVHQADNASQTIQQPNNHHSHNPGQLRQATNMDGRGSTVHPGADERDESEDDVQVKKGFVESVAKRRHAEKEEGNQSGGADGAGANEEGGENLLLDIAPATISHSWDGPGRDMNEGLDDDDSAHPSMQQVVCVEADFKESNQRVVASCQDDERHHVDEGKNARSTSQLSAESPFVFVLPVEDEEICQVTAEIDDDDEHV